MEPTSYCGASRGHIHCENFNLKEQESLQLFDSDEIDNISFWVDMKNCSGIIDSKTFLLVPKLQFLNILDCRLERIAENAFASLINLKSLDIRNSTFPFEINSFKNCNLTAIHLADMQIKLENLLNLKYVEQITFENCHDIAIPTAAFKNFSSLNTLTFDSCRITKIDLDAFDDMKSLSELRFMDCEIGYLDCKSFLKLSSLKFVSFHSNVVNGDIDYEIFKNLPQLENIFFDINVYKDMDFSGYPKLKTVTLGYKDDNDVAEQELQKSIILKLEKHNLQYECVLTGKVEVNMDEVQICG